MPYKADGHLVVNVVCLEERSALLTPVHLHIQLPAARPSFDNVGSKIQLVSCAKMEQALIGFVFRFV